MEQLKEIDRNGRRLRFRVELEDGTKVIYVKAPDQFLEVEIGYGNIANEQTDAITNAANSRLWLGSNVAGAIRAKAGKAVERECNEYVRKYGEVQVGSCATTGAG